MAGERKQFDREDMETAIYDALVSGRVYAKGGEKQAPGEFMERATRHAFDAVEYQRRQRDRRDDYEGQIEDDASEGWHDIEESEGRTPESWPVFPSDG